MSAPRWITPNLFIDPTQIVSGRITDDSNASDPVLDVTTAAGDTHRIRVSELTDDGRSALAIHRRNEHISRALDAHARRHAGR